MPNRPLFAQWGFHHSVLGDFRDRLLEEGRADRLLDLVLARLKEAGLVRERTSQRTDSTHVLAAVRDLTRLELVTEADHADAAQVGPARRSASRSAPVGRRAGPRFLPEVTEDFRLWSEYRRRCSLGVRTSWGFVPVRR
jgi:hypothetical protein